MSRDLMLGPHDVVAARDGDGPELLVLWVAPDASFLAVVDRLRPKEMPVLVDVAHVSAIVASGAWVVREGQQPIQRLSWELPQAHRVRRDQAFAVVRSIVDGHVPEVFLIGPRGRLVTEAMGLHGVSRPTVNQWLRRYFHGGMMRDALVPRFERCGAPGMTRLASPESPKRGRPPAPGHPTGVNVTTDVRRWFNLAIDVGYARCLAHDLVSAYQLCVERFLSRQVQDPETLQIRFEPRDEFVATGMPTYGQFVYWFKKDQEAGKIGRRREGVRKWEMGNRSLLGTATAQTLGPGMRYEIDATVLDVYVRARGRRRRLVGRPTLYVVIDVWSRMIVGIYVSLEHPSWMAAAMALANTIEDKVAFCARHGIEIEDQDWPIRHLCGVVLGDKGEMTSAGVEGILDTFGVRVENAASYRGDWKPTVERRFGLIQKAFAPYVDGYVLPDFRERGARDYRDEAVLDLDEITKVIIHIVLYYNNHHELVHYNRHPGQTEDEVPSIPVELWRWGLVHRTGSPRIPDPERFRFALLPRARASVTPHGILFQGRFYTSAGAIRENWFERARRARFTIDVSYDKRDVDRIYVHDAKAERGFEVAELSRDRSAEHLGLSGWESHALQVDAKRISAGRKDEQALERAVTNAEITKVVVDARKAFGARPDGVSAAAERRDMRGSRADHVAADRVVEVAAFGPGPRGPRPADDSMREESAAPSSTAVPSIMDIRKALRDGE